MALARVLDERRVGAEADRLVQPAGRLGLAVNDRLATTFLVEAVQCERADDRAEAAAAKTPAGRRPARARRPGARRRASRGSTRQSGRPAPRRCSRATPGRAIRRGPVRSST